MKLPGFEVGADELDVRLTTSYSGMDGKKGVHLVPERGTRVLAFWSGRYGDSAFCLANVRGEPVDLDSPSLWLEKASRVHVEDVDIQHVGLVRVASDVTVELDRSSRIGGRRPLELDVDGAQVRLSGGIFHTGKA